MADDATQGDGLSLSTPRFDAFVSYSDEDREWAEGFLIPALTASQVRCCTVADFPAGQPLSMALGDAIEVSQRVILVLSPAYQTDHLQQMVGLLGQHFGAEHQTWPVLPVIIQPTQLPLTLRMLNPVVATRDDQWIPSVERICRDLGRRLADDERVACPYPGILPYEENPRTPFFGREAEIEAAMRHLDLNPWLFVIGASGCGKSSLVHAGLVPPLHQLGFMAVRVRPGADPLAALKAAVDAVAATAASGRRPLIVVDQLEEIFAGESGAGRPAAFLAELRALAEQQGAKVVATVRADFYPQLMGTDLWPTVREHRMELVPLSGGQLRKAIADPATAAGVLLQTSLLEQLVASSDRQPGSLPFLQETLVLIWQKRQYRFLPLSAYESLVSMSGDASPSSRSGLEVAMATRADSVIRAVATPEASRIAQRILLRLVQFGDGRDDVRRQQPRESLRSVDDDPAVFDATMANLVKGHLLTVTSSNAGSVVMVDLSHEALIRGWPKLRDWIDERRAAEITRRELEAAAATWIRAGQGQSALLDDLRLREAERWRSSAEASQLGLSSSVEQLLTASRAALIRTEARQRRTQRGLRALSFGLALFLVVSAVLALTARAQRDRAIMERAVAQSGELAVTARSLPETQLDRSLLLAQEAVRLRETPRSLGSLLGTLRANPRVLKMVPFGAALTALAATPDGRTVAVGDMNGQVQLIDTTSGRPVRSIITLPGLVHSVAFSPDGTLVAAASSSGVVQQWRTVDGSVVGPALEGHQGSARAVTYSPDGRWIATAGIDHRVILHPRGAGSSRVLLGHRDWVNTLAFTSDSRLLVSGGGRIEHKSKDGRVLVWDVGTGRRIGTLRDTGDAVRGVALAANGAVATAGADGRVRIWRLDDGSGGAIVARHLDRVYGVAFLNGGKTVASASRDGTILLSDRHGVRVAPPLLGQGAAVRAVVTLGEDRLATVGADARLLIWQTANRQGSSRLARPLDTSHRPVRAVATDPSGSLVATGNDDGVVTIRDAADLQSVRTTFRTGQQPVWGLVFGPGGAIATTSSTGSLQLWDAKTGQARAGPVKTGTVAATVAISHDGMVIATGGRDNAVRLWDPQLNPLGRPLLGHIGPIVALLFRSEDDSLLSAGFDGTLWLWKRVGGDTNEPPVGSRLAASSSAFTSLSLSPDGKTAVTGDLDGRLLFWDTAAVGASSTGRPVLVGHSAPVSVVQHTPDGRRVLSADVAGAVRLWDISAGPREIGELGRGDPARSGGIVSSPGRFLVGVDSGLTAWDIDPTDWARFACDVAGRNLRPPEQLDYLGRTTYVATCPDLPPPPDPPPAPPPTDTP